MDDPAWVSDFAAHFIGPDDEERADSETERDMDPDTWDAEAEFAAARPFYDRIPPPPSAPPTPAALRRAPATPISRRQAWGMLFRGIGGMIWNSLIIIHGLLQVLYALFVIAFIALCLYLFMKIW